MVSEALPVETEKPADFLNPIDEIVDHIEGNAKLTDSKTLSIHRCPAQPWAYSKYTFYCEALPV